MMASSDSSRLPVAGESPFAPSPAAGFDSMVDTPSMPPPAPSANDAAAVSLIHRFDRVAEAEDDMEEPSAVGHAFEPYIGGGAMPAESSLDGEEDEDFNEETESMDEDDLIVDEMSAAPSANPDQMNVTRIPVRAEAAAAAAPHRVKDDNYEKQMQQRQRSRHPLDVVVGTNTQTIYTKMCEVQHNHRPAFTPDSPYVNYRRYLVDWIAETSEDLKLDITTVHVAALYLDRVLLKAHDASSGRCLIPRHLWQLVAMVCLRVAGKFEEREEDVTGDANGMLCVAGEQRVNAVEAFTRHLGDAAQSVTPAQIREWEIFVLEQLGWHLSSVTPVHCLTYFQGRGVVFQDDSWNGKPVIDKIPRYVKKYNDFFANLCLQDYFYTQYSPTHLAAAILYSSRHALSLAPLWRPELQALTGHSKEDVEPVFTHIWKFYADTFPQHARRTTTSPKSVGDFAE